MKAALFSLFSLAAGAFAAHIGQVGVIIDRDETITLSTLTETVKTYTSSISKSDLLSLFLSLHVVVVREVMLTFNFKTDTTVVSIAENPTTVEQNAAVEALAPKLEGITDTLHEATKAAATSDFWDVDASELLSTVLALVFEIVYTVQAIVLKLGLGKCEYDLLRLLSYSLSLALKLE